eukprot:TRINITY_DN7357_c0_g1_i2.p1 TRINITY_DN7357_c0_g1~~TRINITY_DN7357_c0_g1_i2.p1  ORF type:complete len:155 (+),score=18.78 TRINITY_DN7357_c0_g1_i2:66-530(+)
MAITDKPDCLCASIILFVSVIFFGVGCVILGFGSYNYVKNDADLVRTLLVFGVAGAVGVSVGLCLFFTLCCWCTYGTDSRRSKYNTATRESYSTRSKRSGAMRSQYTSFNNKKQKKDSSHDIEMQPVKNSGRDKNKQDRSLLYEEKPSGKHGRR